MTHVQKIVVLCMLVCVLIAVTGYLFSSTQVAQAPERMDRQNAEEKQEQNPIEEEYVACTMDAKMCPDGSFVGRTGPNCEFAPCPDVSAPERVTCTDEMKAALGCDGNYAPVCGLVQVQCVTTPCDPIAETFSNACEACTQGNVTSYTEGECVLEVI